MELVVAEFLSETVERVCLAIERDQREKEGALGIAASFSHQVEALFEPAPAGHDQNLIADEPPLDASSSSSKLCSDIDDAVMVPASCLLSPSSKLLIRPAAAPAAVAGTSKMTLADSSGDMEVTPARGARSSVTPWPIYLGTGSSPVDGALGDAGGSTPIAACRPGTMESRPSPAPTPSASTSNSSAAAAAVTRQSEHADTDLTRPGCKRSNESPPLAGELQRRRRRAPDAEPIAGASSPPPPAPASQCRRPVYLSPLYDVKPPTSSHARAPEVDADAPGGAPAAGPRGARGERDRPAGRAAAVVDDGLLRKRPVRAILAVSPGAAGARRALATPPAPRRLAHWEEDSGPSTASRRRPGARRSRLPPEPEAAPPGAPEPREEAAPPEARARGGRKGKRPAAGPAGGEAGGAGRRVVARVESAAAKRAAEALERAAAVRTAAASLPRLPALCRWGYPIAPLGRCLWRGLESAPVE
eukprot:tig00000388_g24808.t1